MSEPIKTTISNESLNFRPHRLRHIDGAEIVNNWVRSEDFQYKFVQVPIGLVEKKGILLDGH